METAISTSELSPVVILTEVSSLSELPKVNVSWPFMAVLPPMQRSLTRSLKVTPIQLLTTGFTVVRTARLVLLSFY